MPRRRRDRRGKEETRVAVSEDTSRDARERADAGDEPPEDDQHQAAPIEHVLRCGDPGLANAPDDSVAKSPLAGGSNPVRSRVPNDRTKSARGDDDPER